MHWEQFWKRLSACALLSVAGFAQPPGPPGPPSPSLKNVPVPQPSTLNQYVRDTKALVALGKAFFWDMQASSDGRVACASCHFHAGADHRAANQLANPTGDFAANHLFVTEDFPFRKFSNVNDNRSAVVSDTSQRAGSAGMFRRLFLDILPLTPGELGADLADAPAFTDGGLNVRRVTRRNTPSVINAVFNSRNFWDGRASSVFTGFTPFGDSDTTGAVLVSQSGAMRTEPVHMLNASLASQAVGPILDDTEMSYSGRTWPKLGKKLLSLRALALQKVAEDDSVLGPYAGERGLLPQYSYLALVQAAFQPQYWNGAQLVDASGQPLPGRTAPAQGASEFTQAEYNFSLFWGLALQAYQATLISDDTPYDRFSSGDTTALTQQEQDGLRLFRAGGGGCAGCHAGAEFTQASAGSVTQRGAVARVRNGIGPDTGYFNTGVRPASEDNGLGGTDTFGNPLSLAVRQSAQVLPLVQGAFKTPGLRNVEFTGPYFHNGGQATLEQVIDFYARGGDFPGGPPNGGPGPGGVPGGLRPLRLTPADRAALVAFLKALSDDRVRFERAPFDHPELCLSAGEDTTTADATFSLSAADRWLSIPAVGRTGNTVPLQTFDEMLAGIGADGSRAHGKQEACGIP